MHSIRTLCLNKGERPPPHLAAYKYNRADQTGKPDFFGAPVYQWLRLVNQIPSLVAISKKKDTCFFFQNKLAELGGHVSYFHSMQVSKGVFFQLSSVFSIFKFHLQCLGVVCKSHFHGWEASFTLELPPPPLRVGIHNPCVLLCERIHIWPSHTTHSLVINSSTI